MNGPFETWAGAPDRRQHRRGFTTTPLRTDEAETDMLELGRTVAVALYFEAAHPKAAVSRRLGIYCGPDCHRSLAQHPWHDD